MCPAKRIARIGMALTALCGCVSQQQQPTQGACVVAHESGFVGAEKGQEQITVAQNGNPCTIAATIRHGSMGEGAVVAPPAHGSATVGIVGDATEITYTPARDYVGADSFDVAFGPNFTMTVLVQVVPAAAR
jgi:hypothetical protein